MLHFHPQFLLDYAPYEELSIPEIVGNIPFNSNIFNLYLFRDPLFALYLWVFFKVFQLRESDLGRNIFTLPLGHNYILVWASSWERSINRDRLQYMRFYLEATPLVQWSLDISCFFTVLMTPEHYWTNHRLMPMEEFI